MTSQALKEFEHAILDARDLLNQFDAMNNHPPPPEAEVLKRASLVMALAALETYFEDRIAEAVEVVASSEASAGRLATFYTASLETDLKFFHTPSSEKVRTLFQKYLGFDVTEGWHWNNFTPDRARAKLNEIAKKRGDVAHRSSRPRAGEPTPHTVTRDELRSHISFIRSLVAATDSFLSGELSHVVPMAMPKAAATVR